MAPVKGRVLALAWMLPPLVFPRALQVSRTLKALAERGWDITAVTVLPDAEPNGLQDHRLGDFYANSYRIRTVDPREDVSPSPPWLRLWRRLRPPEDVTGDNWLRRAGHVLSRELKRSGYSVLVTFGQPWIDHLVGLRIKHRFPSLPWVAHFSDPWVDSPYQRFPSPGHESRMRRQERDVIEIADKLVFVTPHTADLVMAKYPEAWRSKVAVVRHGYDEGLLELLPPPANAGDKFRVVHTGSFYPGKREPLALLEAVAEISQDPQLRSRLQVEFVGYATPESVALAKQLGLEDVVTFRGKCLYVDSLAAARNADLLLLIDAPADNSVFLPSKLVDYLMLGKPILGLTPARGASAEVLRDLGCPVIAPDDAPAIAAWLRAAWARWQAGVPAGSPPDATKGRAFEVRRVALDFENALEKAMAGKGAGR